MAGYNIRFENVLPAFLESLQIPESDIWKKNFELTENLHYLVRAHSGKGKSTLLGMLFGARNKYSGQVFIGEKELRQIDLMEWSAIRKDKISMLFQELRLFDLLTVRENLKLKSDLTGNYDMQQAIQWLDALGMADFIDRPCKTLSFGQQQRVAIVRSLLQPFHWLLMDEPFSHLDEYNIQIALELIKGRCRENGAGLLITSLGSTHNYSFDKQLNL
jgi:putative ABC transport system ATP-binding protein